MKHNSNDNKILFGKENWKFVLIGLALILLGYILMIGGKSPNPDVFNEKELYSFRRITLAPILILAGFVVEIYAILKKPNQLKENEESGYNKG